MMTRMTKVWRQWQKCASVFREIPPLLNLIPLSAHQSETHDSGGGDGNADGGLDCDTYQFVIIMKNLQLIEDATKCIDKISW